MKAPWHRPLPIVGGGLPALLLALAWGPDVDRAAGAGVPTLLLTCGPNPVTRGEEVACHGFALGSGAELAVEPWTFLPADSTLPPVESGIGAAEWSGILLTDGTVTLHARVDGVPTSENVDIAVRGRPWEDRRAPFEVVEADVPDLPRRPTALSDLGRFEPLRPIQRPVREVVSPPIPSGPNRGYVAFTDVPFVARARIHVNREALRLGSDFWQIQRDRAPGFCSEGDVVPFLEVVLRHEGLPPAPASHAGLFRDALDERAGPDLEGIVGASPFDLLWKAVPVYERIYRRARAEDDRAHRAPFLPVVHCAFRYFADGPGEGEIGALDVDDHHPDRAPER